MRLALLTSATLLGIAVAGSAFAQGNNLGGDPDIRPGHVPGVGLSYPASSQASNILPADTHSDIAPRLPAPPVPDNASPMRLLRTAQQALTDHRTGEAQEALERAETRLLDRSTAPSNADMPDRGPMIRRITDARDALARGDLARANDLIARALAGRRSARADAVAPMSRTASMTIAMPPSRTTAYTAYADDASLMPSPATRMPGRFEHTIGNRG